MAILNKNPRIIKMQIIHHDKCKNTLSFLKLKIIIKTIMIAGNPPKAKVTAK